MDLGYVIGHHLLWLSSSDNGRRRTKKRYDFLLGATGLIVPFNDGLIYLLPQELKYLVECDHSIGYGCTIGTPPYEKGILNSTKHAEALRAKCGTLCVTIFKDDGDGLVESICYVKHLLDVVGELLQIRSIDNGRLVT